MRNNRVVFISEARWPEYRTAGWFDRVDGLEYLYICFMHDEFFTTLEEWNEYVQSLRDNGFYLTYLLPKI